ncbi:hypothetical protein B0H17DRAFT_1049499 [Mycena rosella]|uniref:Uncharacterized protein n=1 Tax=Mycena rosella TaxID=1033263 RepID=A0AAD7DVP3_MYCRO|nr:hypothetical protein B0H17DRAFT_1049499 [Mycena rosella]
MDTKLKTIVLRAITSPDFVFRFDSIDSYWATIATSTKLWVRDVLEHVGDGRIAPCVFSLLATRWAEQPIKLLKMVCQILVSNLIFSAILMSVGAYRGRIRNNDDVKNVADNFEAYVAAYARQFGTRRLKSWVFRAFGPLVDSIRSACIAAFSTVLFYPPARTTDIEMALTRLALDPASIETTQQHDGLVFVNGPPTLAKRKGSVEDAPSSKKAKLQAGPTIPTVLGDRTNGQGSRRSKSTSTKRSRRAKQPPSDAPPALLQRLSDASGFPLSIPYLNEPDAPALLQRMQSPPFASQPLPQYGFTMPY